MGSYLFIHRARSVKKKKRFVLLFNWIPVESSVPWKAGLLTSVVLQALEKAHSDGQRRRWVRAPPLQTACSGLRGLRVPSTRAAARKEPTPPERPLGAQPRRSPPPF